MEEPVEEYTSPFNFEQGLNTSYLYLSPKESFTPPGSPVPSLRGNQRPDFSPEVGEDAVDAEPCSPCTSLTEKEQADLCSELAKVEDEIQTLSQVLAAKEKQVAEIKRKLGITPLNEFKQNLSKGWQEVTTSTAYKKTSETLSQVGQKATTAFSSVGSAITRKLEDVRNTPTFKSFEEKVETLKTKMSPTPSTGDIEEVSDSTPDGEPVVEQPEGTLLPDQQAH
ncbi:tumor protein D52 isoform X5 [Rhinichthys klamathensis goyatoka]|uniref:tumor protein D52 isoform X5 n=1 Tax=Rhinichthys klamathensis goyatoka TaxID=3034132 RepID=UPI0024B49D64|nr:tumor protein D52 isoform X5 [Rhinichthys klamathensis goyatoka]